ncbi:MAG: hypothetical protein V4608_13270 [Bacteroidota bacterium]
MKTPFIKFTLLGCIAIVGLTNCNNSHETKVENAEQKVEEAKADVIEATVNLEEARLNSAEYVEYKEEAETKLKNNGLKIEELLNSQNKEFRSENIKFLEDLNQKNAKLRARIQEQKEGGKNKWESFKLDFNKEMDELGRAISAMVEKNRK